MIRTKDIMASLPLVASVLGDKYGVNVILGGDQACTNGKTIMLPTLPLDCDAELLALARAFIDHESAHIRHTDFQTLQAANLTPMQKHLWNTLEDWRCENALAALFPGCHQHFRWLIQHHFGKAEDNDRAGDNPALSILNYVLLTVRAWDVPAIEKPRRTEASVIQHAYPGLLSKLDGILDEVRMDCKDTQDAINYALKLSATIEAYAENTKAKEHDEQSGRQGGASPPVTLPFQQQEEERTDCDAQSDDALSIISQAESRRTTRTARTKAQQQLDGMLHSPEGSLPLAVGEQLAEALSARQVKHQPGLTVAQVGHKYTANLRQEVIDESLRSSVALRTRLHGLLQAMTQQPCVRGRRGKLCTQRLHSLVANSPCLFLKRGERRKTSTAVHLLLDCSGSMSGTQMELASRACYAVALALEQCRGVNVGVTAFPANGDRHECAVAPLVRHGERVHHRFHMTGMGYTPLGESLWWVMQQMFPLKEERKVILILTDGMPDSVPAARHALKHAETLGFEVMGLGIQDNNMEILLPGSSRTIHSLPELASAMFGMLQKALLGQGRRA